MKNFTRKVATGVCALMLSAAMAITAFAADSTSADVLSAATSAGVPERYVTTLKNYLDSHEADFTAEDYDYMIDQLKTTSETYLMPKAKELFGDDVDLGKLTTEQRNKLYTNLTETEYNGVINGLKETCATYDVTVVVDKKDVGIYDIKITDKDGNVLLSTTAGKTTDKNGNTTTADKPLNTGANGLSAVEAVAALAVAAAFAGAGVMSKVNRKSED